MAEIKGKIIKAEEAQLGLPSYLDQVEDYEQVDDPNQRVFEIYREDGQPRSGSKCSRVFAEGHEPALSPEASMRKEAEAQLAQARREVERIEREAYERGFEQGQKAGEEFGRQMLEKSVRKLQELIDALANVKETVFQEEQKQLIRLVVRIAEQVVHHELKSNDEVTLNIARAALQKTIKGEPVTLLIHPQDAQLIEQHGGSIPEFAERYEHLTIREEPKIERGGCILLTSFGEIDATIPNQLKLVRDELLEKNQ
ncbi:hypothetical protein JXA32_12190 [Candidatus Sumerlaeota bacterium]|nr:hypothetical protein [Candidatus Sumerlaeota bacterium]